VIPTVSSVPFYTTLIPLVFVLAVTAVKDAFDDIVSSLAVLPHACSPTSQPRILLSVSVSETHTIGLVSISKNFGYPCRFKG